MRTIGWALTLAVAAGLVGEDPRAHPGQVGAHHPEDRVIPPVAATPDGVPPVGPDAERLEQGHIEDQEDDRGPEADAGGAGDALDGAGAGPEPGDERRDQDGDQHQHADDQRLRRAAQGSGGEGDGGDEHGLGDANDECGPHDVTDVGQVDAGPFVHSRSHRVSRPGVLQGRNLAPGRRSGQVRVTRRARGAPRRS